MILIDHSSRRAHDFSYDRTLSATRWSDPRPCERALLINIPAPVECRGWPRQAGPYRRIDMVVARR